MNDDVKQANNYIDQKNVGIIKLQGAIEELQAQDSLEKEKKTKNKKGRKSRKSKRIK